MRKLIFAVCLTVMSANILAQEPPVSRDKSQRLVLDSSLYIKGKKQKKVAFILLATGVATLTIGAINFFGAQSDAQLITGVVVSSLGGVLIITSFPFFYSASQNIKNSRVALSVQPVMLPFNAGVARKCLGASLLISL